MELERGGQVSLKNLKDLEQRDQLNYSEMKSQLIFSKCFTQYDFYYLLGDGI